MKTTTKCITKLVLAKPFTYNDGGGTHTLRAGKVLETIRHNKFHYYPWKYVITIGHGWHEVVPLENVKVKWFKETKTVTVKNKEIEVK